MNLQSKKHNVPSKDKLPPCSTWFRLKAERKIMIERKRAQQFMKEHGIYIEPERIPLSSLPVLEAPSSVVAPVVNEETNPS